MNNDPLSIIILADDDENDRLNFIEALADLKLKTIVLTLNDGVELMNYLTKEGSSLPILLFLDLNMPRKGGLDCLKEIRSNDKLKEVIVAVYSTSSAEKDIEETFNSGANVYLKKPNDFSVLKAALEKIVMQTHIFREPPFNLANFLLKV